MGFSSVVYILDVQPIVIDADEVAHPVIVYDTLYQLCADNLFAINLTRLLVASICVEYISFLSLRIVKYRCDVVVSSVYVCDTLSL